MADVARTRYTTVLILAVIFVSGVLVGMAVDRDPAGGGASSDTGVVSAPAPEEEARGEGDGDGERRRERRRPAYEQVGLTETQQVRIDSIVRHFREEVEAARKESRNAWDARWWEMVLETREAIKAQMNPDQVMRYDSLLQAEYERRDDDRRD